MDYNYESIFKNSRSKITFIKELLNERNSNVIVQIGWRIVRNIDYFVLLKRFKSGNST